MNRRFTKAPLVLLAALAAALPVEAQIAPTLELPKPPGFYTPIPTVTPRPEFWLPDNQIPAQSFTLAHNRLYFGGCTQVGPFTGPFAVVDSTSGSPDLSWPRTNGHVNVVVGDGSGGWWLGGEFSRIGGRLRSNLAHVLADGTIDMWTPAIGSEVTALTVSGTTLFIGGNFQIAGGLDRRMAAAIDTSTGGMLPWRPFLLPMSSSSERLLRIVPNGSVVYLGGYFDSPASYPRRHFTAVDTISGALVPSPNLNPNDMVTDLVLTGSTLYTGGNFTQIAGVARGRVAAIDVTTGIAGPLNPGFDNTVNALALSGTTLYVGGFFQNVAGQPRSCGAAVDVTTGGLLPWDPGAAIADGGGGAQIHDLVVGGSDVFASGDFRSIGGQRQYGVGRVDSTTGTALAWAGDAGGPDATRVQSIALQGNRLACAGNFTIFGGQRREGAAALDLSTGQLAPWNPIVHGVLGPVQTGAVLRILVDGDTAWLGGQFSFVNGDARTTLASVNAHTGATNVAFDAGFFFNGEFVRAMALKGGTLFAGGSFHTPVPGQSNLIAVDAITGAIVPGSTHIGPAVTDMVLSTDQTRLYLAGSINSVGIPSLPRSGLAAIDTTTGMPLPWNPAPNQNPSEVHYVNERVWTAGNFTRIGNRTRPGLASIDPITGGVADAFAPILKQNGSLTSASSLALYGDTVLVGGSFDLANGIERDNLASFFSYRGTLLGWAPNVGSGVSRILIGEGVLVANAASILYPTGESRPSLAVYNAP